MKNSFNILEKINIPTSGFNIELIQDVLMNAKVQSKSENLSTEDWNEISEILWQHIKTGFTKLDEQLLCSSCFYSVLPLTNKHAYYLPQISDIISSAFLFKEKSNSRKNSNLIICLMYGIFQSSYLTYKIKDVFIVSNVLKNTFKLLITMGYEYSHYTFLAFKIIKSFKKICGNDLETVIFNKENHDTLLSLVVHNWENPTTGVRDLLKDIFKTIMTSTDNKTRNTIIEEIHRFYWNKAKYLMLSIIVEMDVSESLHIEILKSDNNWLHGLMWSLHKPGLVSAGADLYLAILKKISLLEVWCTIFLRDVVRILSGTSLKAIENFTNYWCLSTFKKFPSVMEIILKKLEINDTEQSYFSILYVMKQGNKLGILNRWNKNSENKSFDYSISVGLEHANPKLRMMAFDIVCIKHEKYLPSQIEYECILEFLYNNLNSDCVVLRFSLLNSLKHFLSQLYIDFVKYIRQCTKTDEQNFLDFCSKLQRVLIYSLNLNGNYQRKITTIKSINLVWTCFSKIIKKKESNVTLIRYLVERNLWLLSNEDLIKNMVNLLKDPSEDIRENIGKLLFTYYAKELTLLLDELNDDAFTYLRSKFFYEITCGYSILKLTTRMTFRESSKDKKHDSLEHIFYIGYNELTSECKKKDIIFSIENGKQLHSLISIIHVVLEVAILHKYTLKIPNTSIDVLLNTLEDIVNQFLWEQESSTSSDFSRMNDMVKDIIIKAGYGESNCYDETKISGLHQIVLNCLWLNVKASCDLAALIIQYHKDDMVISRKCLNIIAHVLETSRHKGAIESAGAALGQAIQCLTSLPKESAASQLPYELLVAKLREFVSINGKMSSITRRGAGLSIMVHKIVSRDMQKGKPMFHYFMTTLLEECNKAEIQLSQNTVSTENHDLPKAIYIHFFTRIVTDSSLSCEVMFYFTKLAELAFNNLTSSHWRQIRNAALQLYGALIPRQIGQNKVSGTDDETIATVACDELRTHSSELWIYIREQLYAHSNDCSDFISHSNLVPILNLLANIARRYNFTFDLRAQEETDGVLFQSLIHLLGSPIFTVRRLTAKSIFNIFSFDKIYKFLSSQFIIFENMIHGCLMLLEHCFIYYSGLPYTDYFISLKNKFNKILSSRHHSYVCREKFENIFQIQKSGIDELKSVFLKLDNTASNPGTYIWVNSCIKNIIKNTTWYEIPQILQVLLDRNDLENYCNDIMLKIESESSIPKAEILIIVKMLFSQKKKCSACPIWKLLFIISSKIDLSNQDNCVSLLSSINEIEVSYEQRYMIPFAACIFVKAEINNECNLPEIIYKLTCTADVNMRYIAALANNELARAINKMSDKNRVKCIKTAVVLLQDEDEDVRTINVNFYKHIVDSKIPIQPFICLHNILKPSFLNCIFQEPLITTTILYNELSDVISQYTSCTLDEYNPFGQNYKNIYFELEVMKGLIEKLKM